VFDDPQVKARNMEINMPHPAAGEVKLVASPMRLSETPVQYQNPPPMLGQHTAQILASVLGYSEQQITALSGQGII
jgi:formyl-CoA transferase